MDDTKVIPQKIEEEIKSSFIDYAMSVIVSRALPDVRDGLKPVHRRILYAMNDLNLPSNKPHKKSARIVGEVLGKYHPHGDTAVYDTMVRMAQPWSLRYLMVDGHGNFGSIDGDNAAAMRYTEARLGVFAEIMLTDLDKDTVNFRPNFDETLKEPEVMPARFPNLLVNGSSGIAVGMATNIPPHNLTEVIEGLVKLIEDPEIDIVELISCIKGPDFPTGAYIVGREGIYNAYTTGRGKLLVRAKVHHEYLEKKDRTLIIVDELPYQVNKARLMEQIADLVNQKKIEGIADIRDESSREGMRAVIELKRGESAEMVEKLLYKHTNLQNTFGIINLALVKGKPRVLNLKEMLGCYLEHRIEIIERRSRFELAKARDRIHILEGLRTALDNIDAVIKTIRAAADTSEAKASLIEKFALSEKQAQAILDMRLQRLTGLERDKLEAEYDELVKRAAYLSALLADPVKIKGVVKDELLEVKDKLGDERRTSIIDDDSSITVEDLIKEEVVIVTVSHSGFIKRQSIDTYRAQNRGGKGITGAKIITEDYIEHMFTASTKDYLMFFISSGQVFSRKVYEIPEGSRTSKGKSIFNLINISKEEKISALINTAKFDEEDKYIFMATRKGIVKKTSLAVFSSSTRASGIRAVNLRENDALIGACLTNGASEIMMATKFGKANRFLETDVRSMGRTASGVIGMRLDNKDALVSLEAVDPASEIVGSILTITSEGYAKRTDVQEYTLHGRGGKGMINMRLTPKNGYVVNSMFVTEEDDIVVITKNGMIIRVSVKNINNYSRGTQGNILMRLSDNDLVTDVTRITVDENEIELST